MFLVMFPPERIIIRPPVEARSVLIPVTGGCSWNMCRFCGVYKGIQDFAVRPLKDVLKDIRSAGKHYHNAIHIYLAGGNPTAAETNYLVAIIKEVKKQFPHMKRISCYAKALDILRKSDEELQLLAKAGLTILYMGLESGSNTVLKYMKKGHTARSITRAGKRILDAGINLSLYVILGLGGKKWTKIHAEETAKVLNAIEPTVFRFRTLNVMDNSPLIEDIREGTFKILTPLEVLKEERRIIANIREDLTSALRNDHVSNYTFVQSDSVGKDKAELLKKLNHLIENPEVAKWEHKGLKTI